jgi:hypothetical protein
MYREKKKIKLAKVLNKEKGCAKEIQPISFLKGDFAKWLVGVADGDGSFSFSVNKKKGTIWNCTFKVAQSTYNLRLLYFIKKNLGYGSVNEKSGQNMAEFRIRDRKTLIQLIVPLFKKYPLYSTKHFYFLRWVKALEILENYAYTTAQRNELLTLLKLETPLDTYVSPAWEIEKPSDHWIYGFIEAEGSFFITAKGASNSSGETPKTSRMVHSFGITQKLDRVILEFLQKKFHIPSKVLHTNSIFRDIYKLETTNSRSILRIKQFFLNKFKGIKSLEYRIWARSLSFKGNNELIPEKKKKQAFKGTRSIKETKKQAQVQERIKKTKSSSVFI